MTQDLRKVNRKLSGKYSIPDSFIARLHKEITKTLYPSASKANLESSKSKTSNQSTRSKLIENVAEIDKFKLDINSFLRSNLEAPIVINELTSILAKLREYKKDFRKKKLSNKEAENYGVDLKQYLKYVRLIAKLNRTTTKLQLDQDFYKFCKDFVKPPSESQKVLCNINEIYEHFYTKYQLFVDKIELPNIDFYKDLKIDFPFDFSPIDQKEFNQALSKCKNSSSPGWDRITYKKIKMMKDLHEKIILLYNLILYTGTFPQDWSTGSITLIHKKGDRHDIRNFRPICVTNTLFRLYHKILGRRLDRHIQSNKIIDTSIQKGFLLGKKEQ